MSERDDLTLFAWANKAAQWRQGDESARMPFVLYGVQYLCSADAEERLEPWQGASLSLAVQRMIESLTPRQFAQLFPITKVYKGEGSGVKDYFYTVRMIEERGWDKPIANAIDFLWDYVNPHVEGFLVNSLIWLSTIKREQTGLGIAEEWALKNGIRFYRSFTDQEGRTFLVDDRGFTIRVRRPRPKHLRIIS